MDRQESKQPREFDRYFRDWVNTACREWHYPAPPDSYYAKVYERLPDGLRSLIAFGVNAGLITAMGANFTLKDLPPRKGPYSWFSRGRAEVPAPNWEYFVHVAEFVRLTTIGKAHGLKVTFEDDTMDIAVYKEGKLLVYYEVKERADQLQKLIDRIKMEQSRVDLSLPDRGNDPLRKAKCIVKRKPEYFSGLAIGTRFEYKVVYPEERSFQLVRDVIPWV